MAKTFEIRCKVESVGEEQQVTPTFKKVDVIGVIEGEYPEHLKFEFIQDKVELTESILPGTYVTFFFNLRGRKVEKDNGEVMYFTSLTAWKIEAS